MRLLKLLIAIPVIFLMIGFAKIAQYAAVDAFGSYIGFNLASLVGITPILTLYILAAAKLPDPFSKRRNTER